MKKFLTVALAAAVVALCSSANAGQIWTDGNGDGLPDVETIIAAPSSNVTVGVWVDAQGFSWTNFLAYVEWEGQCLSYVSATYVITGGSVFPIDNFSHPSGIGWSGSGFTQGGVDQIGNGVFHVNIPTSCCITPIIDVYNPYYVFSQLGAGAAYMLFTTNPGTCYNDLPGETEACCFPDGSCVEADLGQCPAGSSPQGAGTTCDPNLCPQPREACCFPDGACVEAIVGQCPAGSSPQGPGTDCDPNPCQQPIEACCFPDGSCVEAIVGQCPAGSTPQGPGTDCSPNLCPQPREACCFADGSCVDAIVGQCPAGSTGQGAGTDCATFVCPQEQVGACCREDGSCTDGVPQTACQGPNELWFPNQACADTDCPDTATEPTSWGKVKGLYR